MLGKVYSFTADTTTFFINNVDAGITKGPFSIINDILNMKSIFKGKNGTSSISFDNEGGFSWKKENYNRMLTV